MHEMQFLEPVIEFFSHPFFAIVGGVTTILVMTSVAYGILGWGVGITPTMLRLGRALWRRQIAIFATGDSYVQLKNTLVDAGLFKEKNIVHITPNNIDKAKKVTVFLVDWETFGAHIETVFAARSSHQTALVIFARPATIPNEIMADIANRENTVVVNFRGRLLNDILTSLMTTAYEKE